MNILYIVPSLAQTGPINVVKDLVDVMTSHGHICEVMYFNDISNYPLNSFQCPTTKISFKSKIDWKKFDIVHSHGFKPDLFVKLKCPRSIKRITTMHNFIFRESFMQHSKIKAVIKSLLILWAAREKNTIITLVDSAIPYYERFFKKKKLALCYNTRIFNLKEIDCKDKGLIDDFKKKNNLEFIIGTNCNVTFRKGLDQIIKAMTLLPNVGLIIVGTGDAQKYLKDLAVKEGVSNRILWLGHKPEAYRYISTYDLFIIPSRSEGFPLALLEAAAIGKASVSSDISVFRDTFSDEELTKFKLEDFIDLSRKITFALENKDILSKRIKEKFENSYSPEVFYNQHIMAYNSSN